MNSKDKIQFIKRLSLLIKANLSLENSLSALVDQAKRKRDKKLITAILNSVKSGEPLSSALKNSHKSFSGIVCSVVRVGEESGFLSDSLSQLVVILERGASTRSKIVHALLYPAIVGLATLVLVGFLVMYIFPKITPVFKSLKVELPVATKILISASNFLRENFLMIIVAFVLVTAAFTLAFLFWKAFGLQVSKIVLRPPVLGSLVQSYVLSRISMLLGTLLSSHMKVDEALGLVSQSIQYPAYKEFLNDALPAVFGGKSLSELCSQNKVLFPSLFTDMIAVGEMSGNFSEVLKDVSMIYESELENSTKTLTHMIEPVMMIFMSLLVGFVAISIIAPLYSVTNNIRH